MSRRVHIPLLVRLLASLFLLTTLLPLGYLRWMPPPTSSFMLQQKAAARKKGDTSFRLEYRWVSWDRIASSAAVAVVAAEDQKFKDHNGFDTESIEEAWDSRHTTKRPRGASTISQQVAKNLFLWPGKTFLRKGLEAYYTVFIELLWPKRRIIEVYLNIAEFGRGTFGVGAASERFFGKPPSRLTDRETALLAAVLPSPLRMHADRPSAYVEGRVAWILGQMAQLGGAGYLKGWGYERDRNWPRTRKPPRTTAAPSAPDADGAAAASHPLRALETVTGHCASGSRNTPAPSPGWGTPSAAGRPRLCRPEGPPERS
ncbi:monofunctional biosynthetic peptidoglycan transglycosylase [Candidatus Fermentibacteria bacterium]|nr:monofunctional biosynthetic peptidoglycan transglycosylase [Candidatus Fermentibacteria bacterium]